MPPAVSHITMPNRRSGVNPPGSVSKGRKLNEKTDEEEPTPIKKGKGRPKGSTSRNKNSDEDKADVDNEPSHYHDFDEDDSDDESRTSGFSSKKNPKYYIVKNEKNGRPIEVFRTDRLHDLRMGAFNNEDSDEEHSGPQNGMIKLHDRWREEWNYGIQVPVNCLNLPVFETASTDLPILEGNYKQPEKYIATSAQNSQSSTAFRHTVKEARYLDSSTHESVAFPERLFYNGDRLDKIWIEGLNRSRAHNEFPPLEFKQFLKIMNALEIQCYHKLHEELIQPLHINTSPGISEDDSCDICGSMEHDEGDDMLYCDNCNACFHLSCYGLDKIPKGKVWKCQRCIISPEAIPSCIMCPCRGGALKQTEVLPNGQTGWCHVGCALWIPECKFSNPEARENVSEIGKIPEERWHMKCVICDTRKGACIQCKVETCRAPFHVGCATRSGYEMRIEANDENPESDVIEMIALCEKHRSVKSSALKAGDSKSKLSSDEEIDERENVQLKNLETRFFMYIDDKEIINQLHENELNVSDVYEYWKLKRHRLGGKSLISTGQHDFIEEAYNSSAIQAGHPVEQVRKAVRVNLDKTRVLAHMVVNREKTKHELVMTELAMINNVLSQLLSPAPQSDRSISQLTETIKSTMPTGEIQNAKIKEEEIPAGVSEDSSKSSRNNERTSSKKVARVASEKTKKRSPSPKKIAKSRMLITPKTSDAVLQVKPRTRSPKKTVDITSEKAEHLCRTRSGVSFSDEPDILPSTSKQKPLQKSKVIKIVRKQASIENEPTIELAFPTKSRSPKKILPRKHRRRTSEDSDSTSYSPSEDDSDDSEEVATPLSKINKRARTSSTKSPERRNSRSRPESIRNTQKTPQLTVRQKLVNQWNETPSNSDSSPPPELSPVSSPYRHAFVKQSSVTNSEASEEIGEDGEYLRNRSFMQSSISPPPRLSPNFTISPGFKKNLNLGYSSPKRPARTSPFKESNSSHSISQRTRHRTAL